MLGNAGKPESQSTLKPMICGISLSACSSLQAAFAAPASKTRDSGKWSSLLFQALKSCLALGSADSKNVFGERKEYSRKLSYSRGMSFIVEHVFEGNLKGAQNTSALIASVNRWKRWEPSLDSSPTALAHLVGAGISQSLMLLRLSSLSSEACRVRCWESTWQCRLLCLC